MTLNVVVTDESPTNSFYIPPCRCPSSTIHIIIMSILLSVAVDRTPSFRITAWAFLTVQLH